MCEEKLVFVSRHMIRRNFHLLKSLKPLGHFSSTEDVHP